MQKKSRRQMSAYQNDYYQRWTEYVEIISVLQACGQLGLSDQPECLAIEGGAACIDLLLGVYEDENFCKD